MYLSAFAWNLQTKGNLTKHMKSKVHQRKCFEMGIIPVPMTVDESQLDPDMLVHHVEIQEDGKVTVYAVFHGLFTPTRMPAKAILKDKPKRSR